MPRSVERKNPRMKQWDYSSAGLYFVTICIKNREYVFGDVIDGRMVLNDLGKLAHESWQEIPIHFPDIEIDQFVIMPNHVHGIVVIENIDDFIVGDRYICPLQQNPSQKKDIKRNVMKLPTIIGTFKAVVTREHNKKELDSFQWQRSFHDHIIRNERELRNIQNYIHFNPDNWRDDDFFVQSS